MKVKVGELKSFLESEGVSAPDVTQLLQWLGGAPSHPMVVDDTIKTKELLKHLLERRTAKALEDYFLRLKLHEILAR